MSIETWEDAVRWYRNQPDNETEILNNYFDLPVIGAAERFARSEEFTEVLRLLGPGRGRKILEIGAGNGIASFAFAINGWQVTALEPDTSFEVGAGAIATICESRNLSIEIETSFGEALSFPAESFDAVFARQALHHAADLEQMVKECSRVLKRSGVFLATREHVADDELQLAEFRLAHPLHSLYGGENAFPLKRYLAAFDSAGLNMLDVWGPLETILNFFPGSENDRQRTLRLVAKRSLWGMGVLFSWSPSLRKRLIARATRRDSSPGRIFSFFAQKP